jgi:mannose/fructose/N-acetylgalactosamine-specific phosphotransferase system component IIB
VDSIGVLISKVLYVLNERIAKIIFTNTARDRLPKIIIKKRAESKVNKINKANIEKFLSSSPDSTRDIQGIFYIINKITAIESLDQSLIKLSSLNSPLMKTIKELLCDNKLTNYEKKCISKKV